MIQIPTARPFNFILELFANLKIETFKSSVLIVIIKLNVNRLLYLASCHSMSIGTKIKQSETNF